MMSSSLDTCSHHQALKCFFNRHSLIKHMGYLGHARFPQRPPHPNITFERNHILKLTPLKNNLFTVDLPEVVNQGVT